MVAVLIFLFNIVVVPFYAVYFKDKVLERTEKDATLTADEKIKVLITEFLNPLFTGAIYYYGWKEKLPRKAREANEYSWVMFFFSVSVSLILGLLYDLG